ncbi:MAG: glycosyltransferase family 9 protein, partial [Chitinispirillaceae bacterium]|nr:glycosyltransferase family 9 protein [Chitinispirillaceae bacterium]
MKILCICPIGIGNYLLCYPAWALLQKRLPDAELHLLALRKPILDLAANDPLWNTIHCIDPTKQKGTKHSLPFITTLRRERYDLSLSYFPSNTWQYNLLPFLAGAKKRFAFRYRLKRVATGSFLNTSLLPVDTGLHDVEQNLRLSSHVLGISLPENEVRFPRLFTGDELHQVKAELPPGRNRYLAVHPGSSAEHGMDAKRWPTGRFAELADRAAAR